MSISSQEQYIYNTHLKYSRHGVPWRPRKDFSDIDSSTILILSKLKDFFSKFKHIKLEDFFEAPLILYPEEKYPPLKYFISRAAIKTFSLSQKKKINQSPDSQLDSIKSGFEFIAKFCIQNLISMENYPEIKNFNMPLWLEHYRLHLVNPYCFLVYKNLNFDTLASEDLEAWAPDLKETFSTFKIRFHNSASAKDYCDKIFKTLKLFTESELKKKISTP